MHIYCDGQQFNISSVYTSENIEDIINHLLTMNFSTKQDILDLYTFWGTISQQNHSDLEDFLVQVSQGSYTNQAGRSLMRIQRVKRIVTHINRILSVQFIRQEKQIPLSDLPIEVMQLLFQNNVESDVNKLFKTAIKNDSYRSTVRDFFFGILMGNVVDQDGLQFSRENHGDIYIRSWSVVYIMILEYSKSVYNTRIKGLQIKHSNQINLDDVQQKVVLSISKTAQNNRSNLEQQDRAIKEGNSGSYSYIRVSVDNEMTRIIDRLYKDDIITKTPVEQEVSTVQQPTKPPSINILTRCYQKLAGQTITPLLLPNASPNTHTYSWMHDLEYWVFSFNYLSQHFTRKNQEETKKRIIALYQSMNQNELFKDSNILENSQDQARRCRRKYIQKLLEQLFLEFNIIEEKYESICLKEWIQKIIPKVFSEKKMSEKIKEATAIKNMIEPLAWEEDILIDLLEQLLQRKPSVSTEQFLCECKVLQTFSILIVVVNAIQQRSRAKKDESNAK